LVVFDKENRRIGFKKFRINDEINLDKKYHYTNIFPYKNKNNLNSDKITIINLLCFILILLCFIGIIVLLFGKNNYYNY
jgi:nitric oxide reductase large subunit